MYSHIQEQVVALSTNMNVEDIAKNEEVYVLALKEIFSNYQDMRREKEKL